MLTDFFSRWWNQQAQSNGKLKFRDRREAEDFVRNMANRSGGPNRAMVTMRREYLAIQEKRNAAQTARPESADCRAV